LYTFLEVPLEAATLVSQPLCFDPPLHSWHVSQHLLLLLLLLPPVVMIGQWWLMHG
jgi:hypothetical protein